MFWYKKKNGHKKSQQKQEWQKKQTIVYFEHIDVPMILTSQLLTIVSDIGWFAWLEEKEEINIHWTLCRYV